MVHKSLYLILELRFEHITLYTYNGAAIFLGASPIYGVLPYSIILWQKQLFYGQCMDKWIIRAPTIEKRHFLQISYGFVYSYAFCFTVARFMRITVQYTYLLSGVPHNISPVCCK